jgi:hypothetical protein
MVSLVTGRKGPVWQRIGGAEQFRSVAGRRVSFLVLACSILCKGGMNLAMI